MTPLRVLLPLALLIAVTLAEFPSSNQIKSYGKEDSSEDGIILPNNPGIEPREANAPEDNETKKKETTENGKNTPDDGKDSSVKPAESPNGKKDEKTIGDKDSSKNPVEDPNGKKDEKTIGDKDSSKNPVEDPSGKKDENTGDGTGSPGNPVEKPKGITDDTSTPKEPKTPSYRLPEDIVPLEYTIELSVNQNELPKEDSKYSGKVSIKISVKKATKVIKLHYDRRTIEISKLTLVSEKGTEIVITETPETNLDVSICELTAKEELAANALYTLTLEYEGKVNDVSVGFYKGSYFNDDNEKRWYVVTHFEPLGARKAFPCFDEPALKAEFTIIIKYTSGYTAISNMPVEKNEEIDKDWKKVTFKKTPKMSTYLVAYAITDFQATGDKSSQKVYSRKEVAEMAEYAATTGEEVLKELGDYTDIKFELPKMDQIALPLLKPGAMENWGLVTYRESALLYDEKINATIDRQKVASIIAHEFAHQWFGNLVSPKWWSYIWLNEGFATYFQYYIADKIDPTWRFMDQFNVAALQGTAFVSDADWAKTRPMDKEESKEEEIGDMFDDVAYQKAASVIRMFVHVLGEDKFQKGIKNYLKEHKGGVATSADLFKALDGVVDKDTLPEGATVAKVFGSWATQKGYPVVKVTKNKKTGAITVSQEPFYLEEPKDEAKATWYIPLNYVQENDEHNFENTEVQEWLTEESKKISQKNDKNEWIIFNKQQTGYYRVNYDDDNWAAIARYLSGENFTSIHPLNRAQLIDDALNLALTGRLKYEIALSLLEYLEQETDYIVWKSAFAALDSLNKRLAPTDFYGEFSKYLLAVTESLMSKLTYTPAAEEEYVTKLLRVDAIKWACAAGSESCKTYATEEVDKWLSSPLENATLPRDLQKVLICGALRNATFDEWHRVFVKYVGSTNTEEKAVILSALGCSSEEETLKYLLNLVIQPDSIFTGRMLDVFQTVYSNSAVGVQVTLDFIIENINKLLTYDVKFYDNLEKYLNELGTRVVLEDDANKLQQIVAKKVIPLEKTQDAVDAAQRNVKWLKANGKDINNWFGTYNSVTESPPVTTTKKGNSAGSLSFTTFLLAVPLLLARLR